MLALLVRMASPPVELQETVLFGARSKPTGPLDDALDVTRKPHPSPDDFGFGKFGSSVKVAAFDVLPRAAHPGV